MPAELHITSAIVQVRPESVAATTAHLAALPGVEVHAAAPTGKIIVTLETANERAAIELLDAIRALPGTIDTAMVFHGVDQVAPNSEERLP